MDGVTTTGVSDGKNFEGNTLNSPLKIIIKKENIGLEPYQHQKFQFNLFNNTKRDQYYEDLCKVKDRLEKAVPNMQQVIQSDMKRVKINKVYERKLHRDLTGPRGLNWRFRQELQRLESDERDVERDLIRLNRDLTRIALSSARGQSLSLNQNKDLSRSPTPRLLLPDDIRPTSQRTKLSARCSFPVTPNTPTTVNRFSPIYRQRSPSSKMNPYNEKSPWVRRQTISQADETRSYHHHHIRTMHQQQQDIEQKLKQFLL